MSPKNQDDDDLVGFREFLDQEPKPRQVKEKRQVNHEMQTFLERETDRLTKLVSLYDEKSLILKDQNQSQLLRQKASAKSHQLKKEVMRKLKNADGRHFKKNLEVVLRSHFKN